MPKHEIKIMPDSTLESKRIYANFAIVSKSPFDFSIQFCNVPPISDIHQVEKKGFVHYAPVVAEIAVPKEMIPGLIEALTTQLMENKREDDVEIRGL
jgi:hypothetical protein